MKQIIYSLFFTLITIHGFSQNPAVNQFYLANLLATNSIKKPINAKQLILQQQQAQLKILLKEQSGDDTLTINRILSGLSYSITKNSQAQATTSITNKNLRDSLVNYTYPSTTDSVPDYKYVYNYDEYGYDTLTVYSTWNSDNSTWIYSTETEYYCDEEGNDTLRVYSTWDSDKSLWVYSTKYEYSYDENGNQTLYAYSIWDSDNNIWLCYSKMEYSYDDNSNKILYCWSYRNTTSNALEYKEKGEYAYDDDGNMILIIYSNWDSDNNVWVYSTKFEYNYDENGNQTLTSSTWNSFNSVWVYSSKSEYSFDEAGNDTLFVVLHWNSGSNNWEYSHKYELSYDENGNETLNAYSTWDSESSTWIIYSKAEYSYNENGNQTLLVYSTWDSDNNELSLSYKRYIYYSWLYQTSVSDSTLSIDAEAESTINFTIFCKNVTWSLSSSASWFAMSQSTGSVNSTITLTAQENATGSTRTAEIKIFAANVDTITIAVSQESKEISSIGSAENTSLSLFPNPATNSFQISGFEGPATLSLYTTDGKLVLAQPLEADEAVSVSGLNSGTYVVKLITSSGVVNKTLVKE